MARNNGGLKSTAMVIAALTIGFLGWCRAEAYEYQVKGSLDYLVGESGTIAFNREFSLAVSNCLWTVRVEAGDQRDIRYNQVMYDGESMYRYTALDAATLKTGAINQGVAVIEKWDVPAEDGSFANMVWLGLASGCYFQKAETGKLAPLWSGNKLNKTLVGAEWESFKTSPYLPKQVAYFQGPGRFPAPYDQGWKEAEFTVVAFTNADGLTIPLEYTYTQFRPRQNAKDKAEVDRQYEVHVKVQAVSFIKGFPVTRPAVDGITLIGEARLSDKTAAQIVYTSTNQELPSQPEERAIKLNQERELASSESKNAKSKSKTAMFVIVSICLLSGVFLIGFLRKRT